MFKVALPLFLDDDKSKELSQILSLPQFQILFANKYKTFPNVEEIAEDEAILLYFLLYRNKEIFQKGIHFYEFNNNEGYILDVIKEHKILNDDHGDAANKKEQFKTIYQQIIDKNSPVKLSLFLKLSDMLDQDASRTRKAVDFLLRFLGQGFPPERSFALAFLLTYLNFDDTPPFDNEFFEIINTQIDGINHLVNFHLHGSDSLYNATNNMVMEFQQRSILHIALTEIKTANNKKDQTAAIDELDKGLTSNLLKTPAEITKEWFSGEHSKTIMPIMHNDNSFFGGNTKSAKKLIKCFSYSSDLSQKNDIEYNFKNNFTLIKEIIISELNNIAEKKVFLGRATYEAKRTILRGLVQKLLLANSIEELKNNLASLGDGERSTLMKKRGLGVFSSKKANSAKLLEDSISACEKISDNSSVSDDKENTIIHAVAVAKKN